VECICPNKAKWMTMKMGIEESLDHLRFRRTFVLHLRKTSSYLSLIEGKR
jgi:hypothetical protein